MNRLALLGIGAIAIFGILRFRARQTLSGNPTKARYGSPHYDFYEESCAAYAIVLAEKFGLDCVYGLISWGDAKEGIIDYGYVKHAFVEYNGELYDFSGKTNIKKIKEKFGRGKVCKFSLKRAQKEYPYPDILAKARKVMGRQNYHERRSRLVHVLSPDFPGVRDGEVIRRE